MFEQVAATAVETAPDAYCREAIEIGIQMVKSRFPDRSDDFKIVLLSAIGFFIIKGFVHAAIPKDDAVEVASFLLDFGDELEKLEIRSN